MSITAHSPQILIKRPDWESSDFVRNATACSSVALNGSVNHDGDALARAAENVARWKIYLSEECVRAMMNAGWHWST